VAELPAKQFRQVWLKVLALLVEPYPHDAAQLTGYPFHRVDVGEYRIVYRATETEIELLLVGKRNDDEIYKQLKRKT
jgi:mRNA interferase RelE/StbE